MVPQNGEVATQGNGTHICFRANSKIEVSTFHSTAIASQGKSEGEPGPRAAYPIPDVFTTFVRDPFGNKLEAIFNGFEGAGQ